MTKTFFHIKFLVFCISFISIFYSCDDDKAKISKKKHKKLEISRILYDVKIVQTDSIYTNVYLFSPLIEEHTGDKNFMLFPKGLKIVFYSKKDRKNPGYLYADYAKMDDENNLYEAKKNVVIINPSKDTLKTNLLYWNKINRKIYTDDTVRIMRADGVTTNTSYGGMEADEDFKNFKFMKNVGTLPFKDDKKLNNKLKK